MTGAIEIILDEHRSIGAILKALQAQVTASRDGALRPDWHLFAAMLDYLQAFPEVRHHPKEEHFLFRALGARWPQALPLLDRLHAQHEQGALDLTALKAAAAAGKDGRGSLPSFAAAVDAYAEAQWRHMRTEEQELLPLAQAHLDPEDWKAIDAAFEAAGPPCW